MEERERVVKHRVGAYPSQWAAWQQQAEREGVRSVSALIRRVMTKYLDGRRRKK